MSLTLVMHGRENTEGDSEERRIVGVVGSDLCDRLKNCVKAAQDLDAIVEIVLIDGDSLGLYAPTLKASVEADGYITFDVTKPLRKGFRLTASATGRLSVQMISRALEKSAEMTSGRATGCLTFDSGKLYLFDSDRLERDGELKARIDDLMDEDPVVVEQELLPIADSVIERSEAELEAPGVPETVTVTLNTFDASGNQCDTDHMWLSRQHVSDIVDKSAQLVAVMRDMGAKRSGIDAFDAVYSELEDALTTSSVVSKDEAPLPCLVIAESI